jgi:hypothetical protein
VLLVAKNTRTTQQCETLEFVLRSRRTFIGRIPRLEVLVKPLGEHIRTSCILLRLKKMVRQRRGNFGRSDPEARDYHGLFDFPLAGLLKEAASVKFVMSLKFRLKLWL